MKHFATLVDVSQADFERLLRTAHALKAFRSGRTHADYRPLQNMSVVLLFEKPSLRTRVTFEVAISELGGHPICLGPDEVGLGKRESVSDVSRNLSRWVRCIVARTFKHGTVLELARTASVPVINALTDLEHPCQALGDFLSIFERKGRLKGLTLAFVGDGNNVCHSLIQSAAKCGTNIRVACPKGYEPAGDFLKQARRDADATGASITIMHDPSEAVRGADAVYTDVWTSMGFEEETEKRRKAFAGYRVDAALMARARPGAIFLHCLPAHRGEEVTGEVLDGPASAILDQAENRLHSAKAVLLALLAPGESLKFSKLKQRKAARKRK